MLTQAASCFPAVALALAQASFAARLPEIVRVVRVTGGTHGRSRRISTRYMPRIHPCLELATIDPDSLSKSHLPKGPGTKRSSKGGLGTTAKYYET